MNGRDFAVDIVALLSLGTSVEEEAPFLARDLGMTPYEAALLLRGPSPIIVSKIDDRGRALDLLAKLRARGHDAVACDGRAVVPAESMAHPRSFRIDVDALFFVDEGGVADALAWPDVVAFVRAVHRTRTEQIEKTAARKFDLGRAAMSGGLLLTRKVQTTVAHASEEREPVLYVFRRSAPPLLMQQSRLRYEGLGAEIGPSQLENFSRLVRSMRERALHAPYDERLTAPRPTGAERVRAGPAGGVSASSADGIDVLAHLVALALTRGR